MRSLTVLEKTNIILISYRGELSLSELINDIHVDLTHYLQHQGNRFIIDFSEAKLQFGPHDIQPIRQKFEEFSDRLTFLHVAAIITLPMPTATMLLVGQQVSTPSIQFQAFCTLEAAKDWLLNLKD